MPDAREIGAVNRLAADFAGAALRSDFFSSKPLQTPEGKCRLEHLVFEGPHGGGEPIRIGIFAAIHGDEQAGAMGLLELAKLLAADPQLGQGYHLHLYPVCNPTGLNAGSRLSSSGKDLNREFWRNSCEPEVQLLEEEIQRQAFHGLISLHADDTSGGLYGFVRGDVLARSLLEPALAAAEEVLPRNREEFIDGFAAENGIISQCYEGILTSPPKLLNSPFEIIFETPQNAPAEKQVAAYVKAIRSILVEYRKFISFAADL